MNALRLTEGVDARLYPERTGLSLQSLAEGRHEAEQSGLLRGEPARLAATERGQLFLNDLLQIFLNSSHKETPMDLVLDLLSTVSRWSRRTLSEIRSEQQQYELKS